MVVCGGRARLGEVGFRLESDGENRVLDMGYGRLASANPVFEPVGC